MKASSRFDIYWIVFLGLGAYFGNDVLVLMSAMMFCASSILEGMGK